MRVERVQLSGIGPFEDAVFDFGPEPPGDGELVLFEGPNGSGKSTVLEAIALVAGANGFGVVVGGTSARFARRGRADSRHHVAVQTSNGAAAIRPDGHPIGVVGPHGLYLGLESAEWAAFAFRPHMQSPSLETPGPRDLLNDPLEFALSFGANSREPAPPRPSFESPAALLGQTLVNLENGRLKARAAFERRPDEKPYRELAEMRAARIEEIRNALGRLIDREIQIEFPVEQQSPLVRVGGEVLPLDLLGDGLTSTLAWSADLLVRLDRMPWKDRTRGALEQEFWLILDEIEEGLHPQLQARVLPTIRELFPRARIYASTHSPTVVASITKGSIFPIRPSRDHRVRGQVVRRPLAAGESLELVTSDIFDAPTGFVDRETKDRLAAHRADIERVRVGELIDWEQFLRRRDALFAQNDEVKTAAVFEEVPIRDQVRKELERRSEAAE